MVICYCEQNQKNLRQGYSGAKVLLNKLAEQFERNIRELSLSGTAVTIGRNANATTIQMKVGMVWKAQTTAQI